MWRNSWSIFGIKINSDYGPGRKFLCYHHYMKNLQDVYFINRHEYYLVKIVDWQVSYVLATNWRYLKLFKMCSINLILFTQMLHCAHYHYHTILVNFYVLYIQYTLLSLISIHSTLFYIIIQSYTYVRCQTTCQIFICIYCSSSSHQKL